MWSPPATDFGALVRPPRQRRGVERQGLSRDMFSRIVNLERGAATRKGDPTTARAAVPRRIFNLSGALVFGIVLMILMLAEPKPKFETKKEEVEVRA